MVTVPPPFLPPPPDPLSDPAPPQETTPSNIRKAHASATNLDRIKVTTNPLVYENCAWHTPNFLFLGIHLRERQVPGLRAKCTELRTRSPHRCLNAATLQGGSQTAVAVPLAISDHSYNENRVTRLKCSQGCTWPRWVASCLGGKVCPKGNRKNGGRT